MYKRNTLLIISMGIVAALGIFLIILGYALSGVDIGAWFSSKYAITIYIVMMLYIIVVSVIVIKDKLTKL